jgi:hypothetical protein
VSHECKDALRSDLHALSPRLSASSNEYLADQQARAEPLAYEGTTPGAEWHLADGERLVLWEDGSIFNTLGTYMGRLRHTGPGPIGWLRRATNSR